MLKTLVACLAVSLGLPVGSFADDVPQFLPRISFPTTASHEACQPPSATRATAVGAPDRARQTVEQLGVGKKIRLRTMTGEALCGRITSIGDGTFGLDSGQQQRAISFADVNAIERQGMNGWLKGGIIAGAVVGGLMAISSLLASR